MAEKWRPVYGYENLYEVSDQGRIRRRGKVLKIYTNRVNGYPYITLSKRRTKQVNAPIHRLVLQAFVGPCPSGFWARHFPDNDRTNCRLSNLSWDSRSNNAHDKFICGTQPLGSSHHFSKLTEKDVRAIRLARAKGTPGLKLAEKFSVTRQTIYAIANGRSWRHLV